MAQPSDVKQILDISGNQDGSGRKLDKKFKDKKKRPGNNIYIISKILITQFL